MTINDFKNLDEMPWGKHRVMGDFSLRQNETVRNNSYCEVYGLFRHYGILEDEHLVINDDRKKEILQLLIREHIIPYYPTYSGIVKGTIGDAFVIEIIREPNQGESDLQTDLVLYTEIFSSLEELERQRKNYIDFELSKFKEYIINLESQFLNQDSRQFIIDVIEGILK